MPKYVARRNMNTSRGQVEKGYEFQRADFDDRKLAQLIRIGWVEEVVEEGEEPAFVRSTADASTLEAIRFETRTRNIPDVRELEEEEVTGIQLNEPLPPIEPVEAPEDVEPTDEILPQETEPVIDSTNEPEETPTEDETPSRRRRRIES